MKYTLLIISCVVGIGLGFGLGKVVYTPATIPLSPTNTQPMTLTVSIDTHNSSLKTYYDVPIIAGETIADTLERLGTQTNIPIDVANGVIMIFDLRDESGAAFWRVYKDGALAQDQFSTIVNGGEYIELQYEFVGQVEDE